MSRPVIRVVAAVIQRDGKYLITQRRKEAVLGGLWEFPGGRVEEGESDDAALVRELSERLEVEATVGARLAERHTAYAEYDLVLALYTATLPPAVEPALHRVADARWIVSAEFEQYPFPAADQNTMDLLLGLRRT